MKRIVKIKQIVTIIITLSLIVGGLNINRMSVYADETNEDFKFENEVVDLSKNDVPGVMTYDNAVKNKHVKREREKENGLNEVIFQNQDGSHTFYVYDNNVKFVDKDGSAKDIDLGIETIKNVKKKGYTYTNGANDVNIDFPDLIKDGLVVGYEENEVKMYPKNYVGGRLNVSNDKAIYDNIYGAGTQLIYTPTLNGVKEEIVLEKYNKKEKYTFIYEIGNGYISTLDDDCLYIYSETDELVGLIEPIYMIDANNKYNANSIMNYFENSDGTWTVEIIPDKVFLTAEDTVYPVIIDPTYSYYTVNYSNNTTGIQDVTINSTSTSAGYSGSLFVGNRSNTENGISRLLMRIPSVTSSVCSSIEVQSATVTLRDVMCEASSLTIQCCQFTGSGGWSENYASWNAFGGDNVGEEYSSKTTSYTNGVNTSHVYSFDVTVAAKEWINNATKRGQGLVFKASNESVIQHKTFASYQRGSYQPTFTMVYVDNTKAFSLTVLNGNIQSTGYGNSTRPNCAGYALGISYIIDGGEGGVLPQFIADYSSVYKFGESFQSFVNSNVYGRRIVSVLDTNVDWRKYALAENQYMIAARIQYYNNSYRFHFKIQLNDGRWGEKFGTSSAATPSYYNPANTGWSANQYDSCNYLSATVFMVVQID